MTHKFEIKIDRRLETKDNVLYLFLNYLLIKVFQTKVNI
jgi:hypothetical protein